MASFPDAYLMCEASERAEEKKTTWANSQITDWKGRNRRKTNYPPIRRGWNQLKKEEKTLGSGNDLILEAQSSQWNKGNWSTEGAVNGRQRLKNDGGSK